VHWPSLTKLGQYPAPAYAAMSIYLGHGVNKRLLWIFVCATIRLWAMNARKPYPSDVSDDEGIMSRPI
jgi:hypothetical protein